MFCTSLPEVTHNCCVQRYAAVAPEPPPLRSARLTPHAAMAPTATTEIISITTRLIRGRKTLAVGAGAIKDAGSLLKRGIVIGAKSTRCLGFSLCSSAFSRSAPTTMSEGALLLAVVGAVAATSASDAGSSSSSLSSSRLSSDSSGVSSCISCSPSFSSSSSPCSGCTLRLNAVRLIASCLGSSFSAAASPPGAVGAAPASSSKVFPCKAPPRLRNCRWRRASRRIACLASISATRRCSCRSVFCCFFVFTVWKSASSPSSSSCSSPGTQTMPLPTARPVSPTGFKR
mmetsp:Transcript_62729/g.141415  ORF Transcript_62729/g.141415 Transcript_62729/m.141415 type:complete len:287 (+) Transcript_62729:852-1712(+)